MKVLVEAFHVSQSSLMDEWRFQTISPYMFILLIYTFVSCWSSMSLLRCSCAAAFCTQDVTNLTHGLYFSLWCLIAEPSQCCCDGWLQHLPSAKDVWESHVWRPEYCHLPFDVLWQLLNSLWVPIPLSAAESDCERFLQSSLTLDAGFRCLQTWYWNGQVSKTPWYSLCLRTGNRV